MCNGDINGIIENLQELLVCEGVSTLWDATISMLTDFGLAVNSETSPTGKPSQQLS